ncbi:MAG: TylF/MycF/NovP-related O-methyltransferase [bacterium]
MPYSTVIPNATYSPWRQDGEFQTLYDTVRSKTLVDIYRCYELWSLVEQSAKLQGCLIEIGVWKGGTGSLIAKKARLAGIADSVYLCDTFSGVVKASPRDFHYKGGEHADTSRREVEELTAALALTNVVILEGVFPDETALDLGEKTFRFCHIDVDVYYSAKDILDWIWDKMVTGGIIVLDDYGFEGCEGITQLINEQRNYPDRLIIHNLNGHAIVIKLP